MQAEGLSRQRYTGAARAEQLSHSCLPDTRFNSPQPLPAKPGQQLRPLNFSRGSMRQLSLR
ncbi:MAG: hypothetical protein DYG98_18395 [Haliscomenobacteraceae bacterium CHB4]|nr:hypothetical protein [Haliscomenobacteraceae bacterium CHB4]